MPPAFIGLFLILIRIINIASHPRHHEQHQQHNNHRLPDLSDFSDDVVSVCCSLMPLNRNKFIAIIKKTVSKLINIQSRKL